MNEWMFVLLLILASSLGSISIVLILNKQEWNDRLGAFFRNWKHPFFLYAIEGLLAIAWIISFYSWFNQLVLFSKIVSFSLFLCLLFGICLELFVFYLWKQANKQPERIFLVLMIPLGIFYMFLLFPDFVPDEQAHFMKAYSTSLFNFSSDYSGKIYGDYDVKFIHSIKALFDSIYLGADTTLNVPYNEACSYNFVIYIIPAIALGLGRLLHLSIYLCYYLGRLANFSFFLFVGYHAIKRTPYCKWLFLIFYFNPMLIQLGISYSADLWINSICIFSVSNFLYLHKKDCIEIKDIILVMLTITGILISKYVYLPLFGMYLILIPKLIKMPKKNWMIFLGMSVFTVVTFVISFLINSSAVPVPNQQEYLEAMNVDSSRQVAWIIQNPMEMLHVFKATYNEHMEFYINSFVNCLGWLDININSFSYYLFYASLYIVACMESGKIKIIERAWAIILGLMISGLVVLGLYIQWTGVGALIVQGVQGRYFIPVALLFLLAISNPLLSRVKMKHVVLTLIILLIQLPVLFDLLQYVYALSF